MSDLARTLAFAFRRKGVETMAGSDLRLLLAYDLRWFAPEDAKKVVQRALETGLLSQDGDAVRAAFELGAVQIPLNFRPTTAVLDEEVAPLPPAARPPHAPSPPPPPPPASSPSPPPAPAAPQTPAPVPPTQAAQAAPDLQRAADDERRKRGLLVSPELAHLIVRRRLGDDVADDAVQLEARLLTARSP